MCHQHLNRRGHIQGLRAIAVLGVLLFHFGLKELPGGFVGVDIFFVISGYLISKSIFRDADAGQFSFRSFYERRARRILPALIVISTVTMVAGSFILFPQALVALSKSFISSLLFSANIYFYYTSDYFAPSANQIPLLHLWSLGVEEQFYLFFPLIMLTTKRLPRAATIIGLTLLSFVSSVIALHHNPAAAFYLFPFRGFEILLGSCLALPQIKFPVGFIAKFSTITGVLLLICGMFFISEKTPFPGEFALIPCLGTALTILGCENSDGAIRQLLGSRPMLFIGDISYSLYLIHWPMLVYAMATFPDTGRFQRLIVLAATSIMLAWLAYKFIEQPFRNNIAIWNKERFSKLFALTAVVLLMSSSMIVYRDGYPGRVDKQINGVLSYLKADRREMFQMGKCFMNPNQIAGSAYNTDSCIPKNRPFVLLWGDSSVSQYYWGLRKPLSDRGYYVGQMTASSCAPIVGLDVAQRPNCRSFNDFALAKILSTKPDLVVMGAVWNATPVEMAELDKTISVLRAAGLNVILFGPTPLFKQPVPTIMANRMKSGKNVLWSGSDLEAPHLFARDKAMATHFSSMDVKYVSVVELTCPGHQCPMSRSGIPLYLDNLHLSKEGSEYYGRHLAETIAPKPAVPVLAGIPSIEK